MKKILVFTEFYEPFEKGGGPIQSVKNIVSNLNDKFSFKIITNDRDLGDEVSSTEIEVDKWTELNNAKVYYTNITLKKIKTLLKTTEYDIIYINSFFSFKLSIFLILMHKLKIIKDKVIILAPRGEFSKGALSLKSFKKKLFIAAANLLGLYNNVRWHATAESEKQDIINCIKKPKEIFVVNNLTADYTRLQLDKRTIKTKGMLNLIFISRIHPKKNLKFALSLLESIKGDLHYKIYGPIEDQAYWNECKNVISNLPDNIKVTYEGILSHRNIIPKLQESHVFLFPTLGENYGHVISEALVGGCPVIISDQTPWLNLEELNVGFDVSLSDKQKYIDAIQDFVDLDNEEYLYFASKAFNYGIEKSNNDRDIEKNYRLFNI